MVQVGLTHAVALIDQLIGQRLSEPRFVLFVMPVAAIAVHVDNDIALELAAEVHRQIDDLGHGLRMLTIHMEDRNLQHLADVSAVLGRTGFVRTGREADLIVDDDVQRATRFVALQLAQVERLLNDTFARKCGVTMDLQRQHA